MTYRAQCWHRANLRIRKSHTRRQSQTHLPNSTAPTNSLLLPKPLPLLSRTVFSSQSSRALQALLPGPPLRWPRPLRSTRPLVLLLKLLA